MSDAFQKIKYDAFNGDYLTRLLYLNIAVFLVYSISNAFTLLLTGNSTLIPGLANDFLALSSDPARLLVRPWTLLTYMFTHFSFRHILFNMLILYFSGKMLMEYLGQRRMLALYIYGGIGGGLLYLILYNVSPLFQGGSMVGASAGTIAILVAGAMYLPHMPVRLWGIFEIKYWMLAAGIVFIDLMSLTGSNAGGHMAHLGGAVVAYFFIKSMRKGNEWNVYLFQVIDAVRGVLYRNSKKNRGFKFGDAPYVKYKDVNKNKPKERTTSSKPSTTEMDAILDKIKEKGYDSLSAEEKATLFKISNDA
jgi:membrane associated rhomboid family serine protease